MLPGRTVLLLTPGVFCGVRSGHRLRWHQPGGRAVQPAARHAGPQVQQGGEYIHGPLTRRVTLCSAPSRHVPSCHVLPTPTSCRSWVMSGQARESVRLDCEQKSCSNGLGVRVNFYTDTTGPLTSYLLTVYWSDASDKGH